MPLKPNCEPRELNSLSRSVDAFECDVLHRSEKGGCCAFSNHLRLRQSDSVVIGERTGAQGDSLLDFILEDFFNFLRQLFLIFFATLY